MQASVHNQISNYSYLILTSILKFWRLHRCWWRKFVTKLRYWWRFWPFRSQTSTIFLHCRRTSTFKKCHQHWNSVTSIHKSSPTLRNQNFWKWTWVSSIVHKRIGGFWLSTFTEIFILHLPFFGKVKSNASQKGMKLPVSPAGLAQKSTPFNIGTQSWLENSNRLFHIFLKWVRLYWAYHDAVRRGVR